MNAVTVDVEDWYHCLEADPNKWADFEDRVVASTRRCLDLFEQCDTRATFYVLGDVSTRHPELVAEIDAAGHEIGSHGSSHRFVYDQSEAEFESDVSASLQCLRGIVDQPVESYRAPYFSITKRSLWALPILQKLGIRFDSSIFPVLNHRYGIPTAQRLPHEIADDLLELPITTFRMGALNVPCGGGVYFRFLPYRTSRWIFEHLNERQEPVVFYLHPWELDPGQPRLPVPRGLRLRHYWDLDNTESKLRRLLTDMSFGAVRDVFAA